MLVRLIWFRRQSPFINEKGSFTLVSGILNDEPIFGRRRGFNRLGRVGKLLFGLPQLSFLRDCVSMW